MKSIPTVSQFMTAIPYRIESDQPISAVYDRMHEKGIRHLPVMKQGLLVGIVSDREIRVIATLPGGNVLTAGNVMTPEPYTVGPDTPLDEVVLAMSDQRIGSAVVVGERGRLLGIFTAVDALRVLGEVLRREEAVGSL